MVQTQRMVSSSWPPKVSSIKSKLKSTIPIGRFAAPVEIAEFASWLVSEKNTYISGQNLIIDGGFVRV